MEIIEQRFETLARQIADISDIVRILDFRVSAIETKGKAQEGTQKTGYVSPWDAPHSYRLGRYNG